MKAFIGKLTSRLVVVGVAAVIGLTGVTAYAAINVSGSATNPTPGTNSIDHRVYLAGGFDTHT